MASESGNGGSRLVSGLLKTLMVLFALGDLLWFTMTFPAYFRWLPDAWISAAMPLVLLWAFVGLPSLILGLMLMRIARHQAGAVLKIAFTMVLLICAAVPLLASFAHWMATPGASFPWAIWLTVFLVSVALAIAGLWGASPRPPAGR